MAIAGALQVNTMLEELDLAETDQVIYMYLLHVHVQWPSRRLTGLPMTRGWTPGSSCSKAG